MGTGNKQNSSPPRKAAAQKNPERASPVAFACVALSIVLQSAAATLGKKAGLESVDEPLLAIVINPWYVAMVVALGLQAITWLVALRAIPLNVAYPWMSLVLPLNLALGWLLYSERVEAGHVAGIVLIALGITLLSRPPATARVS